MSFIQIETRRAPETLDVREIAPRERHTRIFEAFEQLAPGQSFVLINDHDPKPLYYQFQAEQPGVVRWDYLEQGPEVWRVRIGRTLDLETTPILELLLAYPQLKPVLDGFGLDTCCGAHMNIVEAAADAGTDSAAVLAATQHELAHSESAPNTPVTTDPSGAGGSTTCAWRSARAWPGRVSHRARPGRSGATAPHDPGPAVHV